MYGRNWPGPRSFEVGFYAKNMAASDLPLGFFLGMGATLANEWEDRIYRHGDDDNHPHHQDHHHRRDGQWPPWLRPMLSTRFFVQCTKPHHDNNGATSSKAAECNMYCLDCSSSSGALCALCVPSHRRAGHCTVQIRRSSYHDVVRVAEIGRVMDVSGVQTYVINSARVVFLNERPRTKGKGMERGGGPNECEMCRRMLLDSFRFCSLGCKVAAGSKPNKQHVTTKHHHRQHLDSDSEEGSCTTTDAAFARSLLPQAAAAANKRSRRKGVPHRSPFGTNVPFDHAYRYY